MLYIHRSSCISPQSTFDPVDIATLRPSVDNVLRAIEPAYTGIPSGPLRRMGRSVKISVGAALPLLQGGVAAGKTPPVDTAPGTATPGSPVPAAIILGTGNGGLEDCVKFLTQLIEYDEGMLTPGHFVQSTSNAMAAQISLVTGNRSYNATHVHRGLAFENALLDAFLHLRDYPARTCLLGAVDEISAHNDHIENLAGTYKKELMSNKDLYSTDTPGTLSGEGAVMFLVDRQREGAVAHVRALETLHTTDAAAASAGAAVKAALQDFLDTHLREGESVGLFLTGENGDNRLLHFYTACESLMPAATAIARFKHMSGEYPTAAAMGLWLACRIIETGELPPHMTKRPPVPGISAFRNVLLYNNYKGAQHSFMLVSHI
jgi:3-oxoacyl-(acyl-carrier-protein) synthase